MQPDSSRTHHANQAIAISELVSLKFAKLNFGGKTPRTLNITSPEGPSTSGGRQARQSLVLTPIGGKGSNIVCGFIDTAKGSAELRSFVVLDKQNRDRHGEPLDFMRVDYDSFVRDIVSFLQSQGLDARVSNEKIDRAAPPDVVPPAPSSSKSTQMALMLALGFSLGLATGYLIFEVM